MKGAAYHARRTLLGLVSRAAVGGPIEPIEEARIEGELRLSGFRGTLRAHLLRRMMREGLRSGDVRIIFRALDGLFTLACSATDAGVGWEILQNGTYEPHVVAFYRRTLRPGMIVADIGANIGFHALHAASLVRPGGRVIAFEPDPQNVSLFELSLSLNEGLDVDLVAAALSDEGGNVVLSDLGNTVNSGARFTHPDRALLEGLVHGPDPRFETVRALRWDDEYADTPVSFVKIDIEGFEPRALRGMALSIERHRPIVLSEFAPSNLRDLGGTQPAEYLAWFRNRGYRCSVLDGASGEPVPAGSADADLSGQLAGRHHIDLVFTPGA